MTEADQKFIEHWTKKRQHKWRYIFRVGVLYWGWPVALISYFLMVVLDIQDFDVPGLIIQLLVFSGGGLAFGYGQFQASEKRFLQLIQS